MGQASQGALSSSRPIHRSRERLRVAKAVIAAWRDGSSDLSRQHRIDEALGLGSTEGAHAQPWGQLQCKVL
jgi:hypothetical protein